MLKNELEGISRLIMFSHIPYDQLQATPASNISKELISLKIVKAISDAETKEVMKKIPSKAQIAYAMYKFYGPKTEYEIKDCGRWVRGILGSSYYEYAEERTPRPYVNPLLSKIMKRK